jgi:hypothetical protein
MIQTGRKSKLIKAKSSDPRTHKKDKHEVYATHGAAFGATRVSKAVPS